MGMDTTAEKKPGGLEHKWKVLISVTFGIFMIILDATIVNIAFPTLRLEFGASLTQAQWVLSIYVLALGVTTPVSGFLADRFGIKRMYLLGLGIFVLGSFLCGVAPSLGLLMAARALQGFGGGIAQPLGPAQLYRAFPPSEQGTALGLLGIALVVAPALGPILGGWLVGIGAVAGDLLRQRADRHPGRVPRLALPAGLPGRPAPGVRSAGAGHGGRSVLARCWWRPPSQKISAGWVLLRCWPWELGVVVLVVHAIIELYVAKEPMMNFRLFANPVFLNASLVGYIATVALFGAEFLMPVYLQSFRGRTALEAGVILLGVAATSAFATPAGRPAVR